jgi:hypothetical protein
MNKPLLLGTMLALSLACGCASMRTQVGSQKVVERIPRTTPDWVGRSYWEEKGQHFYIGAVATRSDMALGLREAKAEGEKKLVEQIRQRIRTEFGSAIEGQNIDRQTGSYVRDLIAKVSDNVEVSGVQPSETYIEKVEESTGFGVKYVYNCYAQLQLSQGDYLEARHRALEGALEQARTAANAKAEASLSDAFGKLQNKTQAPASVGMAKSLTE